MQLKCTHLRERRGVGLEELGVEAVLLYGATITIYLLTTYSIQYKYIKENEITKQTKSCGEGDNQKR